MNYRLMEHERIRWKTMSDKQLITRLGKITTMEKLQCFIRLCHEHPDRSYLLQHALNRKKQLEGEIPGNWKPGKMVLVEKVRLDKMEKGVRYVMESKPKLKKTFDDERYLDF